MNCLSCGSAIVPGVAFCENCGTAVAGTSGASPTTPPSSGLKGSLGRTAGGPHATSAASSGTPAWTTAQAEATPSAPAPAAAPGLAYQQGAPNQSGGSANFGAAPTMAMGAVGFGSPMPMAPTSSRAHTGASIGAAVALFAMVLDLITAHAANWPSFWYGGWQVHVPALTMHNSDVTTAAYVVLAIAALVGAILGFFRVKAAPWLLLSVGCAHLIVFFWSLIWSSMQLQNVAKPAALLLDPRVSAGAGMLLLVSLVIVGTSPLRRSVAAWSGFGVAMFAAVATVGLATALSPRSSVMGASSYSNSSSSYDNSSSGYTTDSSDEPSSTVSGTLEAQATTLNGIWPAGATWATRTCGSDGVVTAIVTTSSQVAICQTGSADYVMHVIDKTSKSDDAIPATYDGTTQLFTAEGSGALANVKYLLSPTGLRKYTDGQLSSVQSTTSKQRGVVNERDLLAELENLMWTSHDGRFAVQHLAASTYAGNACMSGTDASNIVDEVVSNRSEMLAQGQDLAELADGTRIASATTTFVEAMQHSLDADRELAIWVKGTWSAYAAGGCRGNVSTASDTDWAMFDSESKLATAAKRTLIDQVNLLALTTDLKSDWREEDV